MPWWMPGYEPNRFVVITYNKDGNIVPIVASKNKDIVEKFRIEQSDKYKIIEIKEVESIGYDGSLHYNIETVSYSNIYLLIANNKNGKEEIVISSVNYGRLERYIDREFTKTQTKHYDMNTINTKVVKVI